jgi:hypothetical protein
VSDLRNPLAKARDKYLGNHAALDGAPSGQYLRNRIEAAFCAGWSAAERALKPEHAQTETYSICGIHSDPRTYCNMCYPPEPAQPSACATCNNKGWTRAFRAPNEPVDCPDCGGTGRGGR